MKQFCIEYAARPGVYQIAFIMAHSRTHALELFGKASDTLGAYYSSVVCFEV